MNDERQFSPLLKKFDEHLPSIEHFSALKIILAVIVLLAITREFLSEMEQAIASFDQIQV